MGSSKKHKTNKDREGHKEHKRKRRHKSRSPERARDIISHSPSRKKHKHDKEHKHEKERRRKKEREYMDEIRANRYQARLAAQAAVVATPISKTEDVPEDGEIPETKQYVGEAASGGENLCLSIEQTNKLRAKLGLAPLKTDTVNTEEDGQPPKENEDIHRPPQNLAEMKRQAEIVEKLALIREKRKINQKLGKVKTLAESDSDEESTTAWVKKNRKLVKEREMAEKRAALLDQMDAEFGVGDLVEEAFGEKKRAEYTSRHLSGLTVKHDMERFKEGQNIILTLADSRILDEEDDVLVNVNIMDDERADINNDLKKKKPDYNPYDDPEDDGFGYADADVLAKYNEKMDKKFTLGKGGQYKADYERQMIEFKEQAKSKAEMLCLPPLQVASEYYTIDEMEAKFKKVKKKVRKIRRKPKVLKADDLQPLEDGQDLRWRDGLEMQTDVPKELIERTAEIPGLDLIPEPEDDVDLDPPLDLDDTDRMPSDDEYSAAPLYDEASFELELAINKARKVKQKRQQADLTVAAKVQCIQLQKEEEEAAPNGGVGLEDGLSIVLNSTSEFCRTLGDIPTYGLSGNRNEDEDDLMDLDKDPDKDQEAPEEDDAGTGWQSVEIDTRPVDIKDEDRMALDEEPVINSGVAGALELAKKKGLLDQKGSKRSNAPAHTSITAQNYSIEDKRYDDLDEKYRKRDRYHMTGMTSDFRELDTYTPNVKLEYVDETGRLLSSKEAFRQLSHRFHGKGSGKKKTEKRAKKHEQDMLLKTASSTDTPLGTVALLQEKQKQEQSAYIVLSGGQKGMTTSTISKPI